MNKRRRFKAKRRRARNLVEQVFYHQKVWYYGNPAGWQDKYWSNVRETGARRRK